MPNATPIEFNGQISTLAELAHSAGLEYHTVYFRLHRGWTLDEALQCPIRHASQGTPTHGMTGTKEYRCWKSMKERCRATGRHNSHRYVGRGISVCEEWQNSFEAFFAHIGPTPSPHHSLDRRDNNRGYQPGNIRWANASQQARNRCRPASVGVTGGDIGKPDHRRISSAGSGMRAA